MKYENIHGGTFLSRPNRFIAHVLIDGVEEIAHVKNTGRCKELLIPGVKVFLDRSSNPARKTKWDLIGVYKGDKLINMDSNAPNKVVHEWLRVGGLYSDVTLVKPESTYGKSRFDFYVEGDGHKAYIEVKGVTLELDGVAMFPDAPSERAVRHLRELAQAHTKGFDAFVIFVIQMKGITHFEPNMVTHAAFGEALQQVAEQGVTVLAFDCIVGENSLVLDKEVEVRLD